MAVAGLQIAAARAGWFATTPDIAAAKTTRTVIASEKRFTLVFPSRKCGCVVKDMLMDFLLLWLSMFYQNSQYRCDKLNNIFSKQYLLSDFWPSFSGSAP